MNVKNIGIFLGLAAVLGILAGGYAWTVRLQPLTSYAGVNIGDDMETVNYKLGDPCESKYSNCPTIVPMPGPDDIHSYNTWLYQSPNYILTKIKFDDMDGVKKVYEIACSPGTDMGSCPKVYGLGLNSTEQDVIHNLGQPGYVDIGNGLKLMSYPRLNLAFILSEMKVFEIGVGDDGSWGL